jgi:hypothetical protein
MNRASNLIVGLSFRVMFAAVAIASTLLPLKWIAGA